MHIFALFVFIRGKKLRPQVKQVDAAYTVCESQRATNTGYSFSGAFHPQKFINECTKRFHKVPKWSPASEPDVVFVLQKLAWDSRVLDIRYAAYVLATVFHETSHTIQVKVESRNAKGQPTSRTLKQWRNFTPIPEVIGRKDVRKYKDPVKVFRLPTGRARVTEKDGDQWEVAANGTATPVLQGVQRGFTPSSAVSPTYTNDPGDEHVYYGRGYVQLTWWSNYAKAGAELGRSLDLLFNPDIVLDREIAYELMMHGLNTGRGFANGKTFSQYFTEAQTDYVHARNLVNPGAKLSEKRDFGTICERFESALIACRNQVMAVAS